MERKTLTTEIEELRPLDSKDKIDRLIEILQKRNTRLDYYRFKLIVSFIHGKDILDYFHKKKLSLKISAPVSDNIEHLSDLLVESYPIDNPSKVEELYWKLRDEEFPITDDLSKFIKNKIIGKQENERWEKLYTGGKQIYIEIAKLESHIVAEIPQPLATLLVTGTVKSIVVKNYFKLHKYDTVYVYAKPYSKDTMYRMGCNINLFTPFINGLNSGSFEDNAFPENCYIGHFTIGEKYEKGNEEIISPKMFFTPIETENLYDSRIFLNPAYIFNYKHIELKDRCIMVPVDEETHNKIGKSEGDIYFYWEDRFNDIFREKTSLEILDGLFLDDEEDDEEDLNGIMGSVAGDDLGLYNVIFTFQDQIKHFKQLNKNAVYRKFYVNKYGSIFKALVINFCNLLFVERKESSFNILQKKEWLLDWQCVKFNQGYFIVSQPSDGSVRFKPKAVSAPGVLPSYNYLKDYLNDRLKPIHCSVESMELTIYDTIRLNEAIEKFTNLSRQKGIGIERTQRTNIVRPLQMSFAQALSKAQQMSPEEFQKYKSRYIDFLVARQYKDYKIIPCVERMSYTNNDMTEYAFMFSIKCNSGNIVIVHENVNPARSTLLFVVKQNEYNTAIRAIYDFLQSAEINKRSSLRSRQIKVSNLGINYYRSVNHDDSPTWQATVSRYIKYY